MRNVILLIPKKNMEGHKDKKFDKVEMDLIQICKSMKIKAP